MTVLALSSWGSQFTGETDEPPHRGMSQSGQGLGLGSPEQVLGSLWEIGEGFLEEAASSWDVKRQFGLVAEGTSFVVHRTALPLADLLSPSKHFLLYTVGLSAQHAESPLQNSFSAAILMKPKRFTRRSRGEGGLGGGTACAEPFSQEHQALKSWDQGASCSPSSLNICKKESTIQ